MAKVKQLSEIKALLASGRFRIDFEAGPMLVNREFVTTAFARLYEKRGKRWVQVGPMLLPPEGGDAASLMRMMSIALNEASDGG